jgi:ABC-type multidrug transport system ATPase subunit
MKHPPINIDALTFGYDSRLLFNNFSISFDTGFSLVRGPSGCGKTTLLKLCGGFLDAHSLRVSGMPPRPILILQEDSLWPWITGIDNIVRIVHVSENDITSSPLYALVEAFLYRKVVDLSFGQRRLIELFRALMVPNVALMLDEPLNFLDREKRHLLIQHLLVRSESTPIIMTSHYLENVISDSVKVYEFVGEPPYTTLSLMTEQSL